MNLATPGKLERGLFSIGRLSVGVLFAFFLMGKNLLVDFELLNCRSITFTRSCRIIS
jgi:hypothetical protein